MASTAASAWTSCATCRDAQPQRDLLRDFDSPEGHLVDDGLVVAAFVEHVADVAEKLRMRVEDLLATSQASQLFVGHGEVDDVPPERNGPSLQLDHGHGLGDSERLDVQRAPSPQVAVRLQSGKGRLRPFA